jgi:ParB/RepB/Spo0J family partition protein
MKSKFIKKGEGTGLGLDGQNKNALAKISKKSAMDFVDAPVVQTKPHDLFDDKAKFSGNTNPDKDDQKDADVGQGTKAGVLASYPLSSGAISSSQVLLISDPEKDTTVWEHNPRKKEELEDTSDIDDSIETNGMNILPAIARRKNGTIEVIEGSRRRESCIKNYKPLLAIVVDNMSDEDAKIITIVGNEGRKDASVFSKVNGYSLLLEGDKPICRSKAALARRLGFEREWVSKLMTITNLPTEIRQCLSKKERIELPAKTAIKLAKMYMSLDDSKKESVVKWASSQADKTAADIMVKLSGKDKIATKEKTKVGTMNVVSRFGNMTVVQNKSMRGVLVELPEDTDISALTEAEVSNIIKGIVKQ